MVGAAEPLGVSIDRQVSYWEETEKTTGMSSAPVGQVCVGKWDLQGQRGTALESVELLWFGRMSMQHAVHCNSPFREVH